MSAVAIHAIQIEMQIVVARAAAKIANPKFVLYLQGTAFPGLTVSGPTRRHFSEQCIKLARYVRIGSLLRDRRRKSAGGYFGKLCSRDPGGGRWNGEKLSDVEISSAAQSTSAWYAILLN